MGLDEGLLILRDVLFQRDRLVFGGRGVALERGFEKARLQVQAVGDHGQFRGGVVDLLPQQKAACAGIIIDQEPSFSVEQASSGREYGLLADAVLFGECAIVICIQHLQAPQAKHQNAQKEDDGILCRVQLRGRKLFFAVQPDRNMRCGTHRWLECRRNKRENVVGYSRCLKRSRSRNRGMPMAVFTPARISSCSHC
jgi:hypothetical protein